MAEFVSGGIPMSPRISRLIENLYRNMPEIEADRAILLTESYKQTEGEPIVKRRILIFDFKNIRII